MKLSGYFLAGALMGAMLLAVGAPAKADSLADPKVITRGPTDPVCPPPEGATYTCFGAVDGSGTITEALTPQGTTADFSYDGSGGGLLTSLTVDITNVPFSDAFQCFSDIWVECKVTSPIAFDPESNTFTIAVVFDDLSEVTNPGQVPGLGGACQNNTPAGGTCPGFLSALQGMELSIVTPEPSSALLLLAGLVPIVGFRKRLFGKAN